MARREKGAIFGQIGGKRVDGNSITKFQAQQSNRFRDMIVFMNAAKNDQEKSDKEVITQIFSDASISLMKDNAELLRKIERLEKHIESQRANTSESI